jgi:hypothetical protein
VDLYEAGLGYLRASLSIIALTGKAPNGAIHVHGLKDALSNDSVPGTTYAEVDWEKACKHAQTTGVGIVIPEHLCVVDIDGEEGAAAFQRLAGARVPDTAIAKTSRGLHLWFLSPQVVRSTKLAEKLDLKGLGGYVCAPPSVHPDTGKQYEWLVPLVNEHGIVSADWLPEAIEEIVAERSQIFSVPRAIHGGSIDGLVRHLERQVEGNRNGALFWAACSARDDGTPIEVALTRLVPASGLPVPEARRTIQSAYGGASR